MAKSVGFAQAAVTDLSPLPEAAAQLQEFLRRGYAGTMDYLHEAGLADHSGVGLRGNPSQLFPEARSLVMVALPHERPDIHRLRRSRDGAPVGSPVAAYARGRDYHDVVKELLLELADRIAELAGQAIVARSCVDTAPLLERQLAERAGLSFTGKNTLAIIPGLGSRFLLGELLLDQALPETAEPIRPGCGSCNACLDACPTQAFVQPHLLDARACISYLTIESREAIPREFRPALGTRIFGCDVCQSVCPYNHGSSGEPSHGELLSRPPWNESPPPLAELLNIGSSAYRRLVRGSALRRINRTQLQRNVAVALGNLPEQKSVEALSAFLDQHPEGLASEHAAWALVHLARRHGLEAARMAVEERRGRHPALDRELALLTQP